MAAPSMRGVVRTSSRILCAFCALVIQTLWPLISHLAVDRPARVLMPRGVDAGVGLA